MLQGLVAVAAAAAAAVALKPPSCSYSPAGAAEILGVAWTHQAHS